MTDHDPVYHPTHYRSDATCDDCGSSIECIEVVRHQSFNRGNAIKYLWRAGAKGDTVEDLKKAVWYIQDEIAQLEGTKNPNVHRFNQKPVATTILTPDEASAKVREVCEENAEHKPHYLEGIFNGNIVAGECDGRAVSLPNTVLADDPVSPGPGMCACGRFILGDHLVNYREVVNGTLHTKKECDHRSDPALLD